MAVKIFYTKPTKVFLMEYNGYNFEEIKEWFSHFNKQFKIIHGNNDNIYIDDGIVTLEIYSGYYFYHDIKFDRIKIYKPEDIDKYFVNSKDNNAMHRTIAYYTDDVSGE